MGLISLTGSVLALRFFGVGRTLKWLDRRARNDTARTVCPETETVEACAAAVERAASATGMGTCLSKSVALIALLSRISIAAQLRIGVNKRPTGITAHAWLQIRDECPGPDARAAAFDVIFPDVAYPAEAVPVSPPTPKQPATRKR